MKVRPRWGRALYCQDRQRTKQDGPKTHGHGIDCIRKTFIKETQHGMAIRSGAVDAAAVNAVYAKISRKK